MRNISGTPALPSDRPIRIVTFTSLYPNSAQPAHGIFVENRLRHLVATGLVASRVVAPVPWFPAVLSPVLRRYEHFARAPRTEQRNGLDVVHPRYLVVPKFGMALGPASLFGRTLPVLRRIQAETGDFDLIDAHYFYPDGVAAVLLGQVLRKPVVITARGSDITLIARYALERRMIRYAASRAAGIIAVSQALKDDLVRLRDFCYECSCFAQWRRSRDVSAIGSCSHTAGTRFHWTDTSLRRPSDRTEES